MQNRIFTVYYEDVASHGNDSSPLTQGVMAWTQGWHSEGFFASDGSLQG